MNDQTVGWWRLLQLLAAVLAAVLATVLAAILAAVLAAVLAVQSVIMCISVCSRRFNLVQPFILFSALKDRSFSCFLSS